MLNPHQNEKSKSILKELQRRNSEAKKIVKPKVVKTKFVTKPKTKRRGKTPKRPRKKDDQPPGPSFEGQEDGSRDW